MRTMITGSATFQPAWVSPPLAVSLAMPLPIVPNISNGSELDREMGTGRDTARDRGGENVKPVQDEGGQVLLIGLLVALGLFLVSISVANVGMMVAEKIHLQDSVDAAAYSGAVVEARYMNLAAYINRAMVANYNQMAFDTAVWATVDAYDHGLAVLADLLYKVEALLVATILFAGFAPEVDLIADAIAGVHSGFHEVNYVLNEMFAQDDDMLDLNQYIEMMNTHVLTMYQGFLYAATQGVRHKVQQEVARKMDPDISTTSVIGLGAETVSYDELARAVDFVIRDVDARDAPFRQFNASFNNMAGTADDTDDHPILLTATTEASLDKFTAGWTREGDDDMLRQFDLLDVLPMSGVIETAMDVECYASCAGTFSWLDGDCGCGANVDVSIGSAVRKGQEDEAEQTRVPIIGRRRMREVNAFGIIANIDNTEGASVSTYFGLGSVVGNVGHTSGEAKNDVANVVNSLATWNHGFDADRMGECIEAGCFGAVLQPVRGLNTLNIMAANTMLPVPLNSTFGLADDHWDGAWSGTTPVNTWEVIWPGPGLIEGGEYLAAVIGDWDLEDGVPKYDWAVDVDNVGFPHWTYPNDGAELRPNGTSGGGNNNRLVGPTVAVVGVKQADRIQGLHGLGIGNDYSMSAMARAQVYYLRNPNRPDESPSLFNPHWVARLAPIDSDDSPELLRKGLPYVASIGVPIAPTH